MSRKRFLTDQDDHVARCWARRSTAGAVELFRRGAILAEERDELLAELSLAGYGAEVDDVLQRLAQKGRTR